jgi:tubulin-folding cofactor B
MNDNSKMLGFYSVQSGMEIFVIDNDPYSLSRNGGLTDVSLVEKYKLSDEAYDQRKGTMREWIKEQKKKDPKFKIGAKGPTTGDETAENKPSLAEEYGADSVQGIEVGQRCEVEPGERRGTVRYVGEIVIEDKSKGYWIGVQFDEPLGSNDGSFKGIKLFENCPMGYGAFVRGNHVKVGDFPERDLLADEDEDEL